MQRGHTARLLLMLALMAGLFASMPFAAAQESPASTPIAEPTETITPVIDPTGTPEVEPTETPTIEVTPPATSASFEPAAASPTATPESGIIDHGDGSYTINASPGDIVDLDLSSLIPSGGITFDQVISLSATILAVDAPCSYASPAFYFSDFTPGTDVQGLLVVVGDPENNFLCTVGPTGNLISNGARFGQYHPDQEGSGGYGMDYATALSAIGNTNLPGLKFRLDNSGNDSVASITIGDIAVAFAPTAALNVSVQLCETSDADALARRVDYTLDPFEPSALPDCTMLDPTGIPITTNLLDANGTLFATVASVAQSDGSINPIPDLGSSISMQFGEGVYGTLSDPVLVPSGGGVNVGIAIYTAGVPGSIALQNVNAVGLGGLSGAVFALYRSSCTGIPLATGTTDSNGELLFSPVLDGTYCIANVTASPGFPLIDPVTDIVVTSGEAVNLGNLVSQPPYAPVTLFLVNGETNVNVPGGCAALYLSSGYPFGTPSGLVAPKACDDDGNGSIVFEAPLGVSFSSIILSAPIGFHWFAPVEGEITTSDLPGGITLDYLVRPGNTEGALDLTSQRCEVSDPSDVTTTITIEDDAATPTTAGGCEPLDASFTLKLFGLESDYAPIVVTTSDGRATITGLPLTGDAAGVSWPNTLHAIVDDLRPGASGVSAAFDLPEEGAREMLITVYALPATPTPTTTTTAVATPSSTATSVPTPAPTKTPAPGSTVVALPNTGSGHGAGDSAWLAGIVLTLLGASGIALAARRGGARQA